MMGKALISQKALAINVRFVATRQQPRRKSAAPCAAGLYCPISG